MTEMCFVNCVDNFFTRDLSTTESNCLDKCVLKFSNVNQRVMAAYIRDQAVINERRVKEMEAVARAHEATLAASAAAEAAAAAAAVPVVEITSIAPVTTIDTLNESTNASNSLGLDSSTSSKASALKFATTEDTSQNQSQNLVT